LKNQLQKEHILRERVRKETRMDNIKLSNEVNQAIWQKGLFKTVRKLTIKAVKDKEYLRVYLPNEKVELKKETKTSKKEELQEKLKKAQEKKETTKPKTETKKENTETDKTKETEKE
jgi:ribosomal protein L31E